MVGWAERAGAWTSWIGGMVRTWSWRAVLVLGVVTVLLGVALTLSPIAALTRLTLVTALGFIVSGIADIVSDAADEGRASPRLIGFVWIVFGVAMLAIDAAPAIVVLVGGVVLAGSGLVRVVRSVRRDRRVVSIGLIVGLEIVIGALLVVWPLPVLAIVAVVYGARVAVSGMRLCVLALARRRDQRAPTPAPAS